MTNESRVLFGDLELDEEGVVVLRGGVPVKLHPKPLALLLHLVRNRPRVVSREELLAALWPGITVSDQALWSAVRDLRRALGDTDTAARVIETVRGSGFRFAARPAKAAPAAVMAEASSAASGRARSVATDFVDREEAMATLRASLGAATRGDMRVSFIAGAAGMGKTRLGAELSREARELGFEVQLGACFDREAATPFWPWLQVMRGLLGSERTAGEAQRIHALLPELAFIGPELALPSEVPVHADLDRTEMRFRFFDAAGLFLRRVSAAHPLLIVMDDLHWADEASLLLLESVMAAGCDARIHLIGAFRDPPVPQRTLARVLASSARHVFAERIDLSGLRREAVSFLLQSAAARPPAPAMVEQVLAATAGNPLFVSELAKLALDGQLAVDDPQRGLPVPKRVRDVLRWQFERLSAGCRRVLQLLSVVGSEIELATLAHAARVASRALLDWLSEAEAVGMVVARRQATRFAFAHDLVRESVYRDLSIAARTRLHRCMAQALEATAHKNPGADLGQIAYHYALGAADGAAARAVHFGGLAGEQANARMAYEDAVAHYERALQSLPLLGDAEPKLNCELLLAQAEAAWGTLEDAALVQQRFVAAAEAARAAGAPELLARAALGRSGHRAGPGDFRDVSRVDPVDIALLSEAEAALGQAESELRARVLARLALAVRYGREFEVADELSREAVRIAEGLGAVETLAEVLRYRHEVISAPAFARARVELAERILALARSVRSRPIEMVALLFQTRGCFVTRDFTGAGAAGAAYDALAETMKHPGALFCVGIRSVFVHALYGAFELAERQAREFYERDRARNMGATGTFEVQMIMLGMLRGEHELALAKIRSMLDRYPNIPWLECALVRQHALLGRRADAQQQLGMLAIASYRRLEQLHEHSCLGAYVLLAEACDELGDARHAAALYERMLPYEQLMVSSFIGTIWQGSMAHALGLVAVVLERWESAQRHFEAALAIAEGLGSPPLCALTQERLGALLMQRGQGGDAARGAELVARAVETAERLGMQDILRRSRRSASAARRDLGVA